MCYRHRDFVCESFLEMAAAALHCHPPRCADSTSSPMAAACPCKILQPMLHSVMASRMGLSRMHCQQLQRRGPFSVGRRKKKARMVAVAYMEKPNPFFDAMSKIVGSLPIVGLLVRIASDEGGVGGDRVDFAEFFARVENKCPGEAAVAFSRFKQRHGKVAKPQFVLIWCWAAAVGAGLLKSEDITMAAMRLRVSYDIQYEVDYFIALMDEAVEKRRKSKSPLPDVPMRIRVEKALDGICGCCIGKKNITADDVELLSSILCAVFPSVDKSEVDAIVGRRSNSASPAEAKPVQDNLTDNLVQEKRPML